MAEQYYDDCDYETEEEEEYEVYLNKRARPYPKGPVSKNKRNLRSESQREELLRPMMTQQFSLNILDEEIEAEPISTPELTTTGKAEKSLDNDYYQHQLNSLPNLMFPLTYKTYHVDYQWDKQRM